MHLADLKAENAYKLPVGVYCMDDINAAESLARGEAKLSQPKFTPLSFSASEDWNGKKIGFFRGGGIGDLLFCSPTLREIRKRWPTCEITFACFPHYKGVLENNPDVDHVVSHPMLLDDFVKFDAHFYLEEMHDGNADTHKVHAVDLILQLAGLETDNKELRYEMKFEEKASAWSCFPKTGRQRIGVQLAASAPSRSWPRSSIIEFSRLAIQDGFEVMWLGSPGESQIERGKEMPHHLIDATASDPKLTLRESLALLGTCDGLLGVDSSFTHVAGAIGLPTVALYGPFPSALRTVYAKSIKAIDGEPLRMARGLPPCGPCFHHQRPGNDIFPAHGPCFRTGKCEVMASIDPKRALTKLTRHMRKFVYQNGAT
jgi:ADP-heptose:LPS heptosyltransferase